MYENDEIKEYLNTNANIKNVACLNQIARFFNFEKTFLSFFQSDFNEIASHRKFLELEIALVLKILEKPSFSRWYVLCFLSKFDVKRQIMSTCHKNKRRIDIAVKKWINHNVGERKKYKKIIFATIRQFLAKKNKEFSMIVCGRN